VYEYRSGMEPARINIRKLRVSGSGSGCILVRHKFKGEGSVGE
jgi:hypothetical protein